VTCALALHHFPPGEAVAVLRELARVARRAWVVVDLERSFPAYVGALLLRLVLRNRLTRHDAPASVLRAYTLAELRDLLDEAGLRGAVSATRFPFRLAAYGVYPVNAPSPPEGLSSVHHGMVTRDSGVENGR
jgi:hypothetical protein